MKRFLSILMTAVMLIGLLSILPLEASAAKTDPVPSGATSGVTGDCTWEYDSDTATLTISGSGSTADYDMWNHQSPWQKYSSSQLKRVVIEEGVTGLGEFLFYNCKNFTEVSFPDTLQSIGKHAFQYSYIGEAILPDSLTEMAPSAFSGCIYLERARISENLSELSDYVFDDCYMLKSIVIPDSVRSIGGWAFAGCKALEDVKIGQNVVTVYQRAFRNCDSLKSVVIPKSVRSIGTEAFGYGYHYGVILFSDFVIYGYESTAAQRYAENNGIPFIPITQEPTEAPTETPTEVPTQAPATEQGTLIGDVDGDGVISVMDATRIQKFIAKLVNIDGTKYDGTQPTEEQKKTADTDGDGVISVLDATRIQKYLAKLCNMDGTTPYIG